MKPDKAAEILELNLKEAGKQMPPDCRQAVQLGIEALAAREELKHAYPHLPWDKLPSED